jgi:two-component system nitrogen regulation sensor histidine kinase GlnL
MPADTFQDRLEDAAQLVLNTIRRPVIMVGPDDVISYANADAEDFFRSSAAVLSRNRLDRFVPFGSPLLALVEQVRERRAPVNEYRVDISSPRMGPDKLVDLYVAPVVELPGSVVVMFQERSMADKIDRQMTHRGAARSVSGLAAMLAHEIKNPLSGIRGAAQLLESSPPTKTVALTRLITEETDRIVALVDRMEVFSDERPIDRYPVNIHVVLDRVKASRQMVLRRVKIVEDYDPSLPPVHANRDQLIQVFLNLVKNAAEAIGERLPAVRSRFRPPSARHPVSVPGTQDARVAAAGISAFSDNGPGVPEDLLPILFDPFVTTKPTERFGLGLALVAKIVGDHGGIVECDRRRPRARRSVSSCRLSRMRARSAEPNDGAANPHAVRGQILVADDDAAIRTVLNQALSRAGYEVRDFQRRTLWRWVPAGEGDLVITDVVMPDENAFDMLPRIKKARPEPAGHRHERAEHVHDGDPASERAPMNICRSPST